MESHLEAIRGGGTNTISNMKPQESLELVDCLASAKLGGGGTIASIEKSEELASILNERMKNRQGGNNQRLAIMLGWLTQDKNNPIAKNIPSGSKSQFSQERYKFFLDAPFEISNKCCTIMKKNPSHDYAKRTGRKSIVGTMASESRLRTQKWLQNGCNGFNMKNPTSTPMSFWTEQDVLLYIKLYGVEIINADYRKTMRYGNRYILKETGQTSVEGGAICSVYGDVVVDYEAENNVEGQMDLSELSADFGLFDTGNRPLKTTGCARTGCVLCAYGAHLEKEENSRFLKLKETHPKFYALLDKIENNGVTYRQALEWINENGNMNIKF